MLAQQSFVTLRLYMPHCTFKMIQAWIQGVLVNTDLDPRLSPSVCTRARARARVCTGEELMWVVHNITGQAIGLLS